MRSVTLFALVALSILSACDNKPQQRLVLLGGDTMGTSWSVKITDLPASIERSALNTELQAELEIINAGMSTYRDDSEISRLNQYNGADAFPVSEDFYTVLKEALRVAELSNGAFDITVGPLVNLWGFGPVKIPDHVPSDKDIEEKLSHTGFNKILLLENEQHAVKKTDPDIYIDLSAIAKGYAVDRLAEILEHNSIENYMVEIGGEIRLRGINDRGQAWVIAVEKPVAGERSALMLVQPKQAAIATSGDYRNYFEENGIRYSHTIDPTTGRPITHHLASVSVVSESCMTADALATALMVMGPEHGLSFAKQQNLAVLFVVKTENGFETIATDPMKFYLE
ncbi:MAG: FAD:protein FMN transferase [Gammaproteobacteria bacterium]|nr:FAD:protein FMN transferase [Gammaproteobacteria bacterium]